MIATIFTCLAIALTLWYLRHLIITRPKANQPPVIGRYLPFFGCMFEVRKHGLKGFIEKCKKEYGTVFTLHLFGLKLTFVFSDEGRKKFWSLPDSELNLSQGHAQYLEPFAPTNIFMVNKAHLVKKAISLEFMDEMVRKTPSYLDKITEDWGKEGTIDLFDAIWKLTFRLNAFNFAGEEICGDKEKFSKFHSLYAKTDPEEGFKDPLKALLVFFKISKDKPADNAAKEMQTMFDEVYQSRKQLPVKPKDILQSIIDITEDRKTSTVDMWELVMNMIVFFLGAQANTFATLSWLIYYPTQNPEIKAKLIKEFEDVMSKEQIDFEATEKMTYFDSLVKEIVRFQFHGFLWRLALNPVQIDGYDIPKGNTVVFPVGYFNRSPEYFSQPDEFIPERFMSEEFCKSGQHNFTQTMFGLGKHPCPGEKFVYAMLKVVVYYILKKYDLKFVNEKIVLNPYQAASVSRPVEPITVAYSVKATH